MQQIIKITASHIAKGKRSAIDKCPISLACKEQLKDETAYTGILDIAIDHGTRFIALPMVARNFIFSFDRGEHVEPFEFEVTL